MNNFKKLLAVVLSLIMLVSCFAISVSALTYAPTNTSGEVVISVTADKTTVKPGDTVTFDVCIDPGSKTNLAGSGSLIVYNGDALSPVGTTLPDFRTYTGDHGASYANQQSTSGNMNFAIANNANWKKNSTAEEQAYYTKAIMVTGSSTSSANRWNPAAGESYMQFKMTVSDNVAAGDEIWIGLHEAGFIMNMSNIQYYGDATSYKRVAANEYNLTNSMVKLTVAEDKEPSPVFNKSTQIRFNGMPDGEVKADFDVRTRGYISATALEALCGGTVSGSAITDVGFVYFPGDGMDLAAALEVAKNGSYGSYTRKQCYYVQATGSEYVWTCRVTDPVYGDPALNSVAYITVGGKTYITDTIETDTFKKLYDDNIESFIGA